MKKRKLSERERHSLRLLSIKSTRELVKLDERSDRKEFADENSGSIRERVAINAVLFDSCSARDFSSTSNLLSCRDSVRTAVGSVAVPKRQPV